jgi:hypothetical protein
LKECIFKFKPAPINGGFRMKDYWVWCGSVIQGEDGRFHMFASRWPKYLPMHPGWIVASEIVRAVSETPEGPYVFQEVVLPQRGAEYWDGRMTHNPHITKHGDTFEDVLQGQEFGLDDPRCIVGRANKRIGTAISKSIFGPWKRMDYPILPTRPGKFDSFLTSNPAPCIKEDGSVLLVYKARRYEGISCGKMTIGVAKAENYLVPYEVLNKTPIFPPEEVHIEDPFIWKDREGFALIAKDMEGNICGEVHGGIYATSSDGVDWKIFKGVQSYSRTILWEDGITRNMGSFERPFILFQDGKPTHIFAATADGPGGFVNASETWNMVIPLDNN